MKNISIKMLNTKPNDKWLVDRTEEGIIIKRRPKSDWKNHDWATGEIKIDGYRQILHISLKWWTVEDYKDQWQKGLQRIYNYDKSCLISNVGNVSGRPSIDWWLLYKIGETIHVQNRFLFADEYQEIVGKNQFTPETCFNYIPDRQTHEDDGEEIPELIIKF
ncbi:MAG TPA: hypothetical protein PLU71_02720 [Candidatus Dependentiae bacterium]|nr:hypothetical protein [Candidatus Dependentiae bacterium]HRQ62744.1 hypothetical protein [Candidatus Dependentiae bacterium]